MPEAERKNTPGKDIISRLPSYLYPPVFSRLTSTVYPHFSSRLPSLRLWGPP